MGVYIFAACLNFVVNFLLIIGTNQILTEHLSFKRAAAAAALGGVHAAGSLYFPPLGHTLWRLCAISFMSRLAFGGFWGRRALLFTVLQLAVSGIAAGLHSSGILSVMVTAIGVCAMFLSGVWDQRTKFLPVELSYGGKTVHLTAMRDTGNTLQDPLTGRPVLVLGADVATKLTGLTPSELRHPVEMLRKRPSFGLRLIPYHTIDNPEGMLLGLWIEKAKIGKQKGGALVAFAPERLSEDGQFQALTGGTV